MRVGLLTIGGLAALDERAQLDADAYHQAFDVVDLTVTPGQARTCDVIRVMNLAAVRPALRWRAAHGVPYLVTLGYDHAELARLAGRRGQALAWRVLRAVACRWAAGLHVSAEGLARRWALRQRYPEIPLRVIPNGVPLDRFWGAWREGAPVQPPHVIGVGRLTWEKNWATLIRACAEVGHPVRLTILSEGPERLRLLYLASELGVRLDLPGRVKYAEVAERLRRADVFCLPSWAEGSPKALWEAMACGLPAVVSTGIPAPAGPVRVHAPGDVAELAMKLRDAQDGDPAASKAGRRWVEAYHDLRQTLAAEIAFTKQVGEGAAR